MISVVFRVLRSELKTVNAGYATCWFICRWGTIVWQTWWLGGV